MKLTYENYLVCLALWLLYKNEELDIKQLEDALATQFGVKKIFKKLKKL